jgi:hypothetical protein
VRIAGNEFHRSEVAGAFGDFGTLITNLTTAKAL